MTSVFTTAAMPSTTWLSAAATVAERRRARANTASRQKKRTHHLLYIFLISSQNFGQLAVDSIGTNAREFAPDKYKIAAPGEH